MAELVRDIGQYLVAEGLAQAIGQDIYLNYSPDSPNNVIVLTEYSGQGFLGYGSLLRRVQVLVRDVDYQQSRQKAWSIYNAFIKEDQFIIHLPDRYLISSATQTPTPLMVDDKERQTFVFNLSFTTTKDFN